MTLTKTSSRFTASTPPWLRPRIRVHRDDGNATVPRRGKSVETGWKLENFPIVSLLRRPSNSAGRVLEVLFGTCDPNAHPGSPCFNLAALSSRIEQDRETHQCLAQRDQFGRESGGRGLDSRSDGTKLRSNNKLFKAISIKPTSKVTMKTGSPLFWHTVTYWYFCFLKNTTPTSLQYLTKWQWQLLHCINSSYRIGSPSYHLKRIFPNSSHF